MMQELRNSVRVLAEQRKQTELEIITALQAQATQTGQFNLLENLCRLKRELIDAALPASVDRTDSLEDWLG